MGTVQDVGRVYNTLLAGSGMRVRVYPTGAGAGAAGKAAIGTTLTSDGAAWTYPIGANVKAFVAAATITTNWRYFGFEPFVPAVAGEEYFVLLGAGTGAAAVLTKATSLLEICVPAITVATGQFRPTYFPYAATVIADGLTDAAIGGMCTTAGAADTLTAHVLVTTLLGY